MMDSLFPEIEPYRTGYLDASPIHRLYYEECGNPAGKPLVYLHGGPGAGISPPYRRFYDPDFYRIILLDQRGSGKSTPYASLEENTTWHLVADLERLREHLGIQRWLVFGGSWGSTLALSYALRHPQRVVGLVLRGIYLGRPWENQWLFQEGASYFFPEAWEKYIAPIPPDERGNMISAYHNRLIDPDPNVRLAAAQTRAAWEAAVIRLVPEPLNENTPKEDPQASLAISRIESHYMVNDLFFPTDNYLLENVPSIQHLPYRIVHGRYDLICPVRNAFELRERLPHAELRIVPDAGHASLEPGISRELIQATQDFKSLF
jgi:proline iminopeptidase